MDISPDAVFARIEARLERLELQPEDACKQAGLPTGFITRLQEGKTTLPRGPRLIRLAETLGTSVAYLIGLDPDAPPPSEMLEDDQGSLGLLAGDEEALLRAYRRLDQPAKAALVLIVRKMAGPEPTVDEVPVRVVKRR